VLPGGSVNYCTESAGRRVNSCTQSAGRRVNSCTQRAGRRVNNCTESWSPSQHLAAESAPGGAVNAQLLSQHKGVTSTAAATAGRDERGHIPVDTFRPVAALKSNT
jgi:hypothetical protein